MWQRLSWRLRGYLITGAGVLLLSPDALFVKSIDVNLATFMFWRGLLLGLVLLLIAVLRYRQRLPEAIKACGSARLWCPLAFAASAWCFVGATRLTAAGNALVIMNLAPVAAGLIGLFFFRQRLRTQTWVVIALCVIGAILMFAGEMGKGSPLGLIIALGIPVAIAVNTTVASVQPGLKGSRRGVDTTVLLPFGCLLILLPAILMGGIAMPPPYELFQLGLMGLFLPIAYYLIQTGPRYLPGAKVSLMMILETLVGTLLVWMIIGEVPRPLAFVGGALILSAMIGSGLRDLYRQRSKVARGAPDPQTILDQQLEKEVAAAQGESAEVQEKIAQASDSQSRNLEGSRI